VRAPGLPTLDRKVLRELWEMRGQALAIAMVIAGGVATLVMSLSTLDSLQTTRSTFYRDYRFAEVFAQVKRAPDRVAGHIRAIPGVQRVQTRVVADVNLDIEGFADPATGRLVSLGREEARLNDLYLREGRAVDPLREDEVVVSESFAEVHGFVPGDRLAAIINGRRKELTIVGIALSPEYIYAVRPGAVFPDFEAFGILWMAEEPLTNAYDMDGAFNDVSLTVTPGADVDEVIARLDDILDRYGGLGAYARGDQVSHRFLNEEFRQLEQMATIFPTIFLAVAAFLLNVVVGRLIRTQREEIATLKAFGYRNRDVAIHFSKLVTLIVLLGTVAGVAAGAWLGQGLAAMYMEFYRFPFLRYRISPRVVALGALVSLGASLAGTLYSVLQAARARPAQAMRPEPPARYRETMVERLGLKRLFSQPARMILRNLQRRPVKSLLSTVGIAMACAILMVGSFFSDALDYMIDVQYGLAQREDLAVVFIEPTSYRSRFDLASIPGVRHVEVFRSVPVRLRHAHRTYRTGIEGLRPAGDLRRLLDTELETFDVPDEGMILTDYLGQLLEVQPGDSLTVEVLEGNRAERRVTVAGLVKEYVGVGAYMRLESLNRLMEEGNSISGAWLAVDGARRHEVIAALEETPRVAGTVERTAAIDNFYETVGQQLLTFAFFNTLLAGSIAFGVVYNSARIALSERSRELASLRVLGFRRGEVSYILLGELGILTLVAIPLGFVIGRALCAYTIQGLQTDLFRVPLVVDPSTYSFAATVVASSAVISALIVRRRIDHLDLVGVLKTRE